MKESLQLSPERRLGDWFLSEHNIVIMVYGFANQPYVLPTLLTMRVFALEFIRQRIMVEDEHFPSFKKTS